MPMNVSVTAVPTVRWRCPTMYAVLWTTRFMLNEALMRPPIPPPAKRIIASTCAATDGSPHGSFPNQAIQPLPPRARPPLSSDATTVKNVSRLGKNTANVRNACTIFQPWWMPGSVYWWWKPSGVERTRNRMNEVRANGSLKSLPPAWRGASVYQEMYAGRSQKYTIGWPVNQKSTRASSGSVPPIRPSDHGMSMSSISAAIPSEAIVHIANVTSDMNAGKGVRAPGFCRRQEPERPPGEPEAREWDPKRPRRDERHEAADEEGRPDEHVQDAVQREAVVVGLHQRRRRVHVDARVLERLKEPGHDPAEERHQGDDQIRSEETIQGILRGGHRRASTITLPAMVWCAMPQYSWQMIGNSPG